MGAIPERDLRPKETKTSFGNGRLWAVVGIAAAAAVFGLVYMTWYVAPAEVLERVTVIAVTDEGCVVETFDGFGVNIGECNAQPGDTIMVYIDQKVKERQMAMNPTGN